MLRRVRQAIHCTRICTRNQMTVRVNRDLNRRVPELLLHAHDGFPLLQEQGRKRVAQVVRSDGKTQRGIVFPCSIQRARC
jgi:hypothetical protein